MRKVTYNTWLRNGTFGKTIFCFKCMFSDCNLKEHSIFKKELGYKIRIPRKKSSHYKNKKFLTYIESYSYYKKGIDRVKKGLSFDENINTKSKYI